MNKPVQALAPLPATLADTLPLDLLELARWLVWKLVQRGEGKPTKVPYNAHTGRKANVADATTWATFSEALAAYRAIPGRYAGVGFVLGDGVCGVDLDACREPATGELAPWALAIVRELTGYTEVSPSGTGVHIWLRGALPSGGRRRGPIEMYEQGRFFTITGDALADAPGYDDPRALQDRTGELAALHARIFAPIETPPAQLRGRRSAPPAPMQLADSELILKAHNARNGADFARLWSGDTAGYPSASEADMALIRRLSFWAGPDAARIDALYRQSGMYSTRARKWNSRRGSSTWGAQLIETVLASPGDYYTPPTASASARTAARRSASGGRSGAPDVPASEPASEHIGADRDASAGIEPDAASVYTPIPGTPWYLASDGGPLMERKGRGEGADLTPVYDWDAPTIHARVRFPHADSLAGRAVLYDIELDGQRELVSYGDVHKGDAWERWDGGLGVAGRTAFANMAATVGYLARSAPVHRGMRHTGWVEHATGATGEGMRHALVLPSGELIGASGVLADTRAYLDMAAHHIAPYRDADGEPIETPTGTAASPAAQAAALGFITASAARSLATLATLAHVRSIMYGVWRSDCTVILRGGSGRGKTTLGKWGRNLVGDYGPNTPASAAFTGPTAASIEKHISQLKSLPIVLDDLVLRDDMTPGERADVGKKVDMVARSVANNEAMRQRQTAKMEDAPAYKVDALPILTAEELPPEVKASALNRAIVLDIGETDVQVKRFYEDGATLHRAALQVFGRGFIAWLAGEWDTHGASLAGSWIDTHRADMRRIEHDMCAARGVAALPAYADRLPSNGAHLLLAAHALADYATRAGVACPITPESVYADVLAHLLAQVETIDALATGGNDGEPIGERIAATIREALARGEAFVTNTDGTDATQHITRKPEELGYHAALNGDYTRGRVWLGELTPDGEYLTVERLALDGLLKHTARMQHWRGWRVSARELAATLHKAGLLVTPEAGRHLEIRARRGGRLAYRLAIPCDLLWPDYGEPDGEGDSEGEPIELAPDAPDGGAPEALAEALAPYSPDVVTHGGDAEDGRERAGWGDEDADAAPYAPYAPDREDGAGDEDDTDGGALVPAGETIRAPLQKRYIPDALAADGTPYALMPRTESEVIE